MQSKNYFLIFFVLISIQLFAAENEEAGSGEEEAPVVLDEISGERTLTGSRPWRAPQYQNQESAMGWSPTAFAVPEGLKINYLFWLDIYTKYTTEQGILHDSEYIDLIYEVLDFSTISLQKDLTEGQKRKQKTKTVKEAKKRIVALLKKLEKVTDPKDLTPDEKKIWDYFQKIEGKKKFSDATKKNRLRFQLGQRDRMIQGIFFSGRYLEDFEKAFKEASLPIELSRLPFVESSFNVLARSKVGASGLWQIMRYTGRPYMMINQSVDKRNFPADATRLATKLFRINYRMLESWPLALTGYNHGPAGVLKLTKIHHSRELVDLGKEYDDPNAKGKNKKRRLGFASRNFYPSFLAVLEAEQNAPKYFGNILWSKSLNSVEIPLKAPLKWSEVLKWFDGNDKIAQIYNPHITATARKSSHVIPAKAFISVPMAKKEVALSFLEQKKPAIKTIVADSSVKNITAAIVETTKSAPTVSENAGQEPRSYEVASGDSLYSIAKEFGISVKALLAVNELEAPDKLKVGQKLKIP